MCNVSKTQRLDEETSSGQIVHPPPGLGSDKLLPRASSREGPQLTRHHPERRKIAKSEIPIRLHAGPAAAGVFARSMATAAASAAASAGATGRAARAAGATGASAGACPGATPLAGGAHPRGLGRRCLVLCAARRARCLLRPPCRIHLRLAQRQTLGQNLAACRGHQQRRCSPKPQRMAKKLPAPARYPIADFLLVFPVHRHVAPLFRWKIRTCRHASRFASRSRVREFYTRA